MNTHAVPAAGSAPRKERERMKRLATAVAVAVCGFTLAPAAPALAHAEASHLTPKPGSTVSRAKSRVSLRLSEAVLGGKLTVRDAGGQTVSKGSKLIRGKTRLRARVQLRKGRFTAKATWVADDGDKQSKTWHFSVR